MRSLDQMFFSPTHPVGATGNVIVCGSVAIVGLISGILHGRVEGFILFVAFGAMEVFGFIPTMRKVYAQRRRAREGTVPEESDTGVERV